MSRKVKNYEEESLKSAAFLEKLQTVTQDRKKGGDLQYHRFETISHLSQLSKKRKKLEEELNEFLHTKTDSSTLYNECLEDMKNYAQNRAQEKRGREVPRNGFRDLVQNLKDQITYLKEMKKQGKFSEAKMKWNEQAQMVRKFLEEIKSDYLERQEMMNYEMSQLDLSIPVEEQIEPNYDIEMNETEMNLLGINSQDMLTEYQKAKQKLNEHFREQIRSIEVPAQTWPLEKHERFLAIYKQYIGTAKPRERYMQRLVLDFPECTRKDLEAHDRVVESIKHTKDRKKNIYKDWDRHAVSLSQSAQEMLDTVILLAQQKLQTSLEILKQEKENLRIEQEYQNRKEVYQEKVDKQREQEEKARQIKEEEERKQLEARQQHQAKVKEKAGQYKEIKERDKRVRDMRENERKRKEEKARLEQLKMKKPDIEKRAEHEMNKITHKLQVKEEKKLAPVKQQERINNAIEKYPDRPKLDIDPDRVKQSTKSQVAKKVEFDKADNFPLFKNTGFTADTLMKDMRSRLFEVLNSAGLAYSEYGKRVIQAAPPARPPRADMTSTLLL
jgi:hypothetical protein